MPLPFPVTFRVRVALVGAGAIACGCAVLPQDVGRFGEATVSLTTRFAPLAGRAGALCREREVLGAAAEAAVFDAPSVLQAADAACDALSRAERRLLADAVVLQAYGRELATLAGRPAPSSSQDLDVLEQVAQGVGGSAGGGLTAVTRLARVIRDSLQADARRRITARTVRDAHEPLAAFVDELRAHARDRVVPAVDEAIAIRHRLLRERLVPASAAAGGDVAQRWPLRLAQVDLLRDVERLQAERRQLAAFDAAAEALVEAHTRLRDSFETPDEPARAQAVRTFVDRIRRLHEAARVD